MVTLFHLQHRNVVTLITILTIIINIISQVTTKLGNHRKCKRLATSLQKKQQRGTITKNVGVGKLSKVFDCVLQKIGYTQLYKIG